MCSQNTFVSMVQQVETMIPLVEEFELPLLLANLKRCHMHLSALATMQKPEIATVVEAAHEVRVALDNCNNAEGMGEDSKERLAQVWVGLRLMSEKPSTI